MNGPFYLASWEVDCDWLCWLGMPLLYDGNLCVCRNIEDTSYHNLHKVELLATSDTNR